MTEPIDIKSQIKTDKVVLFMKGAPGASSCGYSTRLVSILDHIGITYTTHDVLSSDEMRRAVKEFTGVRTLPQLFVGGAYVGGSDDIRKLYEAGDLVAFFSARGVQTAPDPSKPELIVGDVSRAQIVACAKAS